jgi:hypothetical protein
MGARRALDTEEASEAPDLAVGMGQTLQDHVTDP